jgi:hypothetical protein
MKNNIFVLLLLFVALASCKEPINSPENSLFKGLDPSIKLPNADTVGAIAYIEGYIDGERFCFVHGKDNVKMIDVASNLFGNDYKKEWNNGMGGAWLFWQPDSLTKRWWLQFSLPTFGYNPDSVAFSTFKRKYSTPNTFTNLYSCVNDSISHGLDNFRLSIYRDDIFNGQPNTLGISSCGYIAGNTPMDQTGSYIKLVSVKRYDYILDNWHYEMMYEFDLKILTSSGVKHLTKGKMRTWVSKIKY